MILHGELKAVEVIKHSVCTSEADVIEAVSRSCESDFTRCCYRFYNWSPSSLCLIIGIFNSERFVIILHSYIECQRLTCFCLQAWSSQRLRIIIWADSCHIRSIASTCRRLRNGPTTFIVPCCWKCTFFKVLTPYVRILRSSGNGDGLYIVCTTIVRSYLYISFECSPSTFNVVVSDGNFTCFTRFNGQLCWFYGEVICVIICNGCNQFAITSVANSDCLALYFIDSTKCNACLIKTHNRFWLLVVRRQTDSVWAKTTSFSRSDGQNTITIMCRSTDSYYNRTTSYNSCSCRIYCIVISSSNCNIKVCSTIILQCNSLGVTSWNFIPTPTQRTTISNALYFKLWTWSLV